MDSDPVQLMSPLSARTYLVAYYKASEPEWKTNHEPLVGEFEQWSLIPTVVLEDAWPGEGWEEPSDEQDAKANSEQTAQLERPNSIPEGIGPLRDQ